LSSPGPLPILLTRPERAAKRLAAQVRARLGGGWPILLSPLTGLRFLAPLLDLQGVDGVVFTSENGVEGFARLSAWRGALAWCVGARTAEAARAAGFQAVAGPGDAAGLLGMLAAEGGPRHPFWARGALVSADLAPVLARRGVALRSAVVYDRERLALSAEARAHLASGAGAIWPVYSAGSAEDGLAALAGLPLSGLRAIAISAPVAELLAPLVRSVHLAERPDAAAMIEALVAVSRSDG